MRARRKAYTGEATDYSALSHEQEDWLFSGGILNATKEVPFASEEEARAAWEMHRTLYLRGALPGSRPFGWWLFEDDGDPPGAWYRGVVERVRGMGWQTPTGDTDGQ